MKRKLKTLLVILLACLILFVMAVLAVNLFANRAIKAGIETAAAKALNVEVSAGNVDFSIVSGKLTLQNLLIKNPPGYQHDTLLKVTNADIEIDVKSILNDIIKIKDVNLDGFEIILEQRGVSGNNLQDIIKGISDTSEEGKKLRVDNLVVSNITVQMKLLPVTGQTETITMKITPVRMTNLGYDSELDTAALLTKILLAIADRVVEEGIGVLPDVDTMTSTLGKTIDASKNIIESTEKIGKGITEGLKNMLKPKQEE
jgi:uncharacterized protein involved in outer membrane biogenesis